ncbi:acyltransferase [Xenorhabdus sp. KJ12.1]|uniref:acyltransferase family protein n=1 Tax=Xenorhabdus sp. KJ12.1 TaxID=1851571 RepID=UPI000C044067|nr:acyltransferase [Xenorhabdus sp. KJ12.1]PHM65383.1 putative acetyltransferase [Xenorhabdus sp. KJ12.1]
MKNEIRTIQYLRGIAAISVVFFHSRFMLNDFNQLNISKLGNILFSSGSFGVDLFFIISGFVITLSTEKNQGRIRNIFTFSVKRIFRIYPLLIIFVLLSAFIYDSNLKSIIKSLIPIHLQYNFNAPFFGLNVLMVAWTLTFELFFYFLFIISMTLSHKYRAIVCFFIIITSFITTRLIYTGEVSLIGYSTIVFDYPTIITAPLSLISSPMILEFCLGMISYYIYLIVKKIKLPPSNEIKIALLCLIFYSFVLCISKNEFTGHGIIRWGFVSFILLTLCVIYESMFTVKEIPPLDFLGNISYSLYMTHQLSAILLTFIATNLYLVGFSKFFCTLFGAIALASLSYLLIEKPFIKVGRNLLKKI